MDNLIKETAKQLNLPEERVKFVIDNYFRVLLKVLTKIRYSNLKSFNGIKTNAVVPGFGKFVVSYRRKKSFNIKKSKDGTEIQSTKS